MYILIIRTIARRQERWQKLAGSNFQDYSKCNWYVFRFVSTSKVSLNAIACDPHSECPGESVPIRTQSVRGWGTRPRPCAGPAKVSHTLPIFAIPTFKVKHIKNSELPEPSERVYSTFLVIVLPCPVWIFFISKIFVKMQTDLNTRLILSHTHRLLAADRGRHAVQVVVGAANRSCTATASVASIFARLPVPDVLWCTQTRVYRWWMYEQMIYMIVACRTSDCSLCMAILVPSPDAPELSAADASNGEALHLAGSAGGQGNSP